MIRLLLVGALWLTPSSHTTVIELDPLPEPCGGVQWIVQLYGGPAISAAVAVYDIPSELLTYAPSETVPDRIACSGFE